MQFVKDQLQRESSGALVKKRSFSFSFYIVFGFIENIWSF